MTSGRPDVIPDHVQPVVIRPRSPNAEPPSSASEARHMQSVATPGSRRPTRSLAAPAVLLLLTVLIVPMVGCAHRDRPLEARELNDDEALYVTRIIVLERVKARLLADPLRGAALGDSLVTAWGDSALPRTLELAPEDPTRATRVHDLLLRLLAAEHDSLLRHGGVRALDAAWPAPADSLSGSGFPASARVRNDG